MIQRRWRLEDAGNPDVPLMLNERHLLNGLTNHPEMTQAMWKKVPGWLENPSAVYTDPKHPGRYTVIAPERVAGYPVVMAVEPSPAPSRRGEQDPFQLLVTVFANTTGDLPALGYLAASGRLQYVDTKMAPVAWPRAGEIPRTGGKAPGAKRILTEKSLVGYRRANTPAASMAPSGASPADSNERNAATQQLVDALSANWTNKPADIIVARNMQDAVIPQEVRKYDALLKSQGATGEPRGFIYKGKAYLLSDQLKGPNQIAEVLFHEVLGHYGLRGVFGKGLTPILQQIATMRRADVAAKAKEYGLDVADDSQRLQAAEEVLAEMAQTTPNIGFVQRAIAAIRTWLRDHIPGFGKMVLTDSEIIANYILPARGWVENGVKTGGLRGGLAFSREKTIDQTMTTKFKNWYGDWQNAVNEQSRQSTEVTGQPSRTVGRVDGGRSNAVNA